MFKVSPDPDDPHAIGAVALVRDGCRNRDFASIIPHQVRNYLFISFDFSA